MDKLNKFGLICVVMVLLAAGCGKKKCSTGPKSETKKMAQIDGMPMVKEEADNLLDDGDISDFAFVDNEANKKSSDANAKEGNIVASADDDDNLEVDSDKATSQDAFAFKSVQFDFNKNSIRPDQKEVVSQDTKVAQQAVEQGKQVVVEGHSCQIGSASYNLALSQRRAESVKEEMVQAGIASDTIKTIGYGYERPVVWSDTTNRKQMIKELSPNRRAEVVVN